MQITSAAIKALEQLFEHKKQYFFRVFIMGGGCSGFEYDFQIEAEAQEDDWVIPAGVGAVLVDPLSWDYLSVATLDHEKNLMGTRFVVHNPLVKRTCGCGQSFSL